MTIDIYIPSIAVRRGGVYWVVCVLSSRDHRMNLIKTFLPNQLAVTGPANLLHLRQL